METRTSDYDFIEQTLDGAEYVLTEYANERSENLQEDVEHTFRGLRNILENQALEDHTDYVRDITKALREELKDEASNTQNNPSVEAGQARKADRALRAINREMNTKVNLGDDRHYTKF